MMALHGKVALVTGAVQGLGKGFSEILLQKGAKVRVRVSVVNETVVLFFTVRIHATICVTSCK